MKFLLSTTVCLIAFASASWAYSGDEISEISKDIVSVINPDTNDMRVAEPATRIKPGAMLYTETGERLGAIRAIIRNGDKIKSVRVGTKDYSAGTVALIDGVARYTSDPVTTTD